MALAALCYLGIALLLFRHLLPVLTTHIFGDPGDPLLNVAILAWNAKHLPLSTEWWNFPAFAPHTGVTAFTEHLLGAYPLTSPIIWITGNPVLAYNVLELTCITLNGVAAYALVRELTGSSAGAFIGGLAFAFSPFLGEHPTHIQMLMAFGMPLALLGLHRYLADGARRHLVVFAIGWLDVLLSNAYLLVFFPIVLALWALWFFRRADVARWRAIVVTMVIAAVPVVPLLAGYQTRLRSYGLARELDEIAAYSATWSSLAGISHRNVVWSRLLPSTFAEGSLFPGFAIVALAIAGAITGRKRVVLFYLAAAVVMWLLALGPAHGPYARLVKLPGAQSIRVPARAWLLATLGLAVCAGFGAAWLASRGRMRWVLVPLGVIIVAECWFTGPLVAVPVPVALYLPDNAIVLDLPIRRDFPYDTDAQYRAVMGNYRVVNGYSGYSPPDYLALVAAVNEHRSSALTPLRRRADLYVIARGEDDPAAAAWVEMQPGVERVTQFAEWKVYRLPVIP